MGDIVEQHIAAAVKLAEARRVAEAAALLADLGERHPNHPGIAAGLGIVALARNDPERALEFFGAAATLDPNNVDLLSNLVSAYRMLGRQEEAADCIERAIQLAPGRADFRLVRAELLILDGDAAGALREIDRALQIGAEDAEVHLVAGVVLVAVGEQEGAEMAFRRALSLAPRNLAAAHNLAELLDQLGRYEEALSYAEQAYLSAPTEVDLTHGYCRRLAGVGRFEDGLKAAKRLLSAMPQDLRTAELVADLQVRSGQVAAGLATIGGQVRRRGNDIDSLMALARLLDQAGRFADGLVSVEEVLKRQPDHVSARQLHRELLTAQGRFAEAIEPLAGDELPERLGAIVVEPHVNVIEAIVLARWLPDLADRYGSLVIEAPPELASLFKGLKGCALGRARDVPDRAAAFLSTVPRLVGLTGDALPGRWPYLTADEEEVALWRHALGDFPGPHIGIVWNRYPPGVEMHALAEAVGGIGTPVSLTIGAARRQLRDWPAALDAGVRLEQPADVLAAVAALDAVVGVDGLAIHLAGAIGKDGFLLAPVKRPWYWLAEEGRARLYPSVRVFAQATPGSWQAELEALRAQLTAWAEGRANLAS